MSELAEEIGREKSAVEINLHDLGQSITVNQNLLEELESRLQPVLRLKELQPEYPGDAKASIEVVHLRISETIGNEKSRVDWSNDKLRSLIDQLEI